LITLVIGSWSSRMKVIHNWLFFMITTNQNFWNLKFDPTFALLMVHLFCYVWVEKCDSILKEDWKQVWRGRLLCIVEHVVTMVSNVIFPTIPMALNTLQYTQNSNLRWIENERNICEGQIWYFWAIFVKKYLMASCDWCKVAWTIQNLTWKFHFEPFY